MSMYQASVAEIMAHIDLASSSGCEDSATEQSTTIRPPSPGTFEKTRRRQRSSRSAGTDQSRCKDKYITESVFLRQLLQPALVRLQLHA